MKFEEIFIAEYLEKIEDNQDKEFTININELTDFSWDEMFIVKPYTKTQDIQELLDIESELIEETFIKSRDDFNLFIFVECEKVQSYARIPRDHGDFLRLEKMGPYKKTTARFKFISEKYGNQDWVFAYSLD